MQTVLHLLSLMDEFACLHDAITTQLPPKITKSRTGLYETQEKDEGVYPLIQLNSHPLHNVVGGSTWNFKIILTLVKGPSHPLVSHMTLNHINSLTFMTLDYEMEIQTGSFEVLYEIWV